KFTFDDVKVKVNLPLRDSDAMTRRLTTETSGTLTTHIYGPGWETMADADENLNPQRVYVSPGGMDSQVAMLSKTESGWKTYYYIRDHLGSVLGLVDAETGAIAESYEYAPYGQP